MNFINKLLFRFQPTSFDICQVNGKYWTRTAASTDPWEVIKTLPPKINAVKLTQIEEVQLRIPKLEGQNDKDYCTLEAIKELERRARTSKDLLWWEVTCVSHPALWKLRWAILKPR